MHISKSEEVLCFIDVKFKYITVLDLMGEPN